MHTTEGVSTLLISDFRKYQSEIVILFLLNGISVLHSIFTVCFYHIGHTKRTSKSTKEHQLHPRKSQRSMPEVPLSGVGEPGQGNDWTNKET